MVITRDRIYHVLDNIAGKYDLFLSEDALNDMSYYVVRCLKDYAYEQKELICERYEGNNHIDDTDYIEALLRATPTPEILD